MFRLVINMESTEPPLSLPGSVEVKTDTYVTTREEAHRALDYILEGLSVPGVDDDKPKWYPEQDIRPTT